MLALIFTVVGVYVWVIIWNLFRETEYRVRPISDTEWYEIQYRTIFGWWSAIAGFGTQTYTVVHVGDGYIATTKSPTIYNVVTGSGRRNFVDVPNRFDTRKSAERAIREYIERIH